MSISGPQENGSAIGIKTVGKSGVPGIDGLLSGVKWSGGSITYSAPNHHGDYQLTHPEWLTGLKALTPAQLLTAHFALDTQNLGQKPAAVGFSVEGFTNLATTFLAGGSGKGTVRLVNTTDPQTAYAYFPGTEPQSGDVFYGTGGDLPVPGNYDHATILHEIGHALGLKHPHDTYGLGTLPLALDAMQTSIMSYQSYPGHGLAGGTYANEKWGYAQTYMMQDIAALQHMYGADYSTNAGNTTYSWNPTTGATLVNGQVAIAPGANRIFLTVWDGGGIDTYDASAYATKVSIDLQPGKASTLSAAQLADLDIYGGHLASGNVYNALLHKGNKASLIENALGGKGADKLVGNGAANVLKGNAGNDAIDGGSGSDKVHGGAGNDHLTGGAGVDYLVGGSGADSFRFYGLSSPKGAADTLVAGDGGLAFDGAGSAKGDVINVSPIDASVTAAGDQAFAWGGTTKKTKGYLWLGDVGNATNVWGNTDNDSAAEFHLKIADGSSLKATAYALVDFIL